MMLTSCKLLVLTLCSLVAVGIAYPGWSRRRHPPGVDVLAQLFDDRSLLDDSSATKRQSDDLARTLDVLQTRPQAEPLASKKRNSPTLKFRKRHCWNMFDMCCTANICGPERKRR